MATATVHASQSSGQVVAGDDVGSALGHATRVSPATVSPTNISLNIKELQYYNINIIINTYNNIGAQIWAPFNTIVSW